MARHEDLELYREYPPAGEERDIERVIRLTGEILRLGKPPIFRGQHAKGTGAVRARLEVDEARPEVSKSGIFERTRSYDAIVRFSNGTGSVQPDTKKDARGMAIKVLGVEGRRALDEEGDRTTQDFVMINFPAFPFRNARQYARFNGLRRSFMGLLGPRGNRLAQLAFFVPWHLRTFFSVATKLAGRSRSPLAEQYWSMSAYRLGDVAIKFTARPQAINAPTSTPPPQGTPGSDDFLSRVLADHLREKEARFDFLIQIQKDPYRMPIEDPSVIWSEEESPLLKVATLVIEKCDLTLPEAREFQKSVEAMSFNPWHSLEVHRPLGGINRLRKAVYQTSTRLRRESNSAR